jgi:hypothetical protein
MKYVQPYGLPDYGAGEGQPYVNGDPTIGLEGSIPPAAAFEHPQRELVSLIKNTGFTPDDDDLEQVSRGVRQQLNFAVATFVPGSPNALSVTLDPPLDQYRAGLVLRVKCPVNNTGPSTLNVNALGARQIVRSNGAATSADDLQAGMVVALVDDGSRWQIINFQGFTSDVTNVNTYIVDIPYTVDTGTTNHIVAPFAPAITSTPAGKLVLVKVLNANTGPVDIVVNAMPVRPVIRCSLIPLPPADIIPGQIIALVYDGTSWQMISVSAQQPKIMIAPMDYYVNDATGSDSNNGLTPGTAFKTIQKAINEMVKWTNIGFLFGIHVADGTYAPFVAFEINGSGDCMITGNVANPQNVLINDTASYVGVAAMFYGRNYRFAGFKVQSSNGHGIMLTRAAQVLIWNIEFGYCGYSHMNVWFNSILSKYTPLGSSGQFLRITGSSLYHELCGASRIVTDTEGSDPLIDMQITASVSFSVYTNAYAGSYINTRYRNLTGASNVVSGKKYDAVENSIISTGGRGTSYLPGPTAGTLSTGGQYT